MDEPTAGALNLKLNQDFLDEYAELARDFDQTAADLFQGHKLERMVCRFIERHSSYISRFPRPAPLGALTLNPNSATPTSGETIEEDLRILGEPSSAELEVPEYAQVLADLYRRACQASYLRVTFNKSRLGREDDRGEPVQWGRFAIRYQPSSFRVSYWYMIVVGWQLDVMQQPRERTLVARLFRQAIEHCIRLEPNDALAHNLLGRYYYSVAKLSWLERTVANKLLGCKLEGSMEDSEREFRLAHQLQDDWLPTGLWLARVLLAQKRPLDQVRQWIDFGLALDCKEPTSEIERRELLELKAKLSQWS